MDHTPVQTWPRPPPRDYTTTGLCRSNRGHNFQKTHQFFQRPDVVWDSGFPRGRHSQRLGDAAEIVVGIGDRNRMTVIRNLFRERIREPR